MSAYICDKRHIVYLVTAAMSRVINPHGGVFRWRFQGKSRELPGEFNLAAEVANMLWRENIKSVSHRYPGESSATLPGPNDRDYNITAHDFPVFAEINPLQVLASLNCYEYQSCEHDEWPLSEAFQFCESLRHNAIRALPGYDNAKWGAPDDFQIGSQRIRKLSVSRN